MQEFIAGTPLNFEEVENFRELGGYKTKDAKTVKRGKIYRTGALYFLKTQNDINAFKKLNIKTVVDFRSQVECDNMPDPVFDGVTYISECAMMDENGAQRGFDLVEIFNAGRKGVDDMLKDVEDAYVTMPFNNKAYKIMFKQICSGNTPLLFHCTAGKDRTGVAAALILRALCVSDEQILRDFEITNEIRPKTHKFFIEKYSKYLPQEDMQTLARHILGVSVKNLQNTLNAIDEKYDNFEDYLLNECEVTKEMLNKMRADLLE